MTGPIFRQNFQFLLARLSAKCEHHPVLLGSTVSLTDFPPYGPFYAHLSRDLIPSNIIRTTAPLVWEWVERINGLGRFASKDVERWNHDSGSFKVDYSSPSTPEDNDSVPPQ